jgi:hypothetical protein
MSCDWLLFLGAGASVPKPAEVPAFGTLAVGVFGAIGWSRRGDHWTHERYPSFRTEGVTPEVLFGTLNRFRVRFARELAGVLDRSTSPNAVHAVAGEVLARHGLVWTTNVDRLVERASAISPHRVGRNDLLEADAGSLVKFHGTVERPDTLAFTDRELLAPLDAKEVQHLAGLAQDKRMILYGYAGADADLFGLLDEVFRRVSEVVWIEPSEMVQRRIRRSFPDVHVRFIPAEPPHEFPFAAAAAGEAFAGLARSSGLLIDDGLAAALGHTSQPPVAPVHLRRPPAITHARLVERFGDPGDDQRALATARRSDALRLRFDAVPAHLRWVRNNSLYNHGLVARAVDALAAHRTVLSALRPRSLHHYAITAEHALRLQRRRWDAVEEFADWAVENRAGGPQPSDLYYRAYGRRYGLQITAGREDAEAAQAGLSAALDPERHAGAVLERGALAIYAGRFEDALRAGFELRERTGRYAIPRWQAWGAWLEAIAWSHLCDPSAAREAADAADARFQAEGRPGPIADVRTARLLAARAELAIGGSPDIDEDTEDAERLGLRYRDDRYLVLADHALARGDDQRADALLRAVAAEPSCPVACAWAALGRAELRRRAGQGDAVAAFGRVAALGADRGAHWLHAQAAIGMALCGDDTGWNVVPIDVRRRAGETGVGDPRVLWMLTI